MDSHTCTVTLELVRKNETARAAIGISNRPLRALIAEKDRLLHPQELAYFDRLTVERRMHSFALGRFVAKQALHMLRPIREPANVNIASGVFQQPVVDFKEAQNLQVSLAHAADCAAAIAFPESQPMGIDIEEVVSGRADSIAGQMTESEIARIGALPLPPSHGLFLYWTVKEALSKILRTGLMTDFRVFELKSTRQEATLWTSTFTKFAQYRAVSWYQHNLWWSVCLPARTELDLTELLTEMRRVWPDTGTGR